MSRFLRPAGAALFVLGFSLIFAACTGDPGPAGRQGPAGPQGESGEQGPTGGSAIADAVFHSEGSNTWIVGGYGDNFTYDGTTYLATQGFVTVDVNDDTNDGIVVAQWDVNDWKYDDSKPAANGTMKVVWTEFAGAADFMDGGIASNLSLHGDSGQEAPVLPTVYTYSAGWGTADIYLNGDMIYQGVSAHYMVTDGTRDPVTHEVHNSDGTGLFVPKPKGGDSGDGFTYPNRLLTHVVVHSQEQDQNNFPPWSMFMHINYENTSISAVARP